MTQPKNLEDVLGEFENICVHEYDDCSAHGEGQDCCLDKEHKRHNELTDFIRSVWASALEYGAGRIKELKKEKMENEKLYHFNDARYSDLNNCRSILLEEAEKAKKV